MLDKEKEYYSEEVKLIVGLDEAGRGPLAGPVVAAAVVFDPSFSDERINDSKQLNEKKREELYDLIIKNALAYAIELADVEEIDKYNILEADKRAMRRCLKKINVPYDLILTDAVPLYGEKKKVIPLIKGDATCLNIAAASILAKVTRDRLMNELDAKYPEYGFKKHKGYGTKKHLEAIEKYGPIEGVHRKTFKPISSYFDPQLKLF